MAEGTGKRNPGLEICQAPGSRSSSSSTLGGRQGLEAARSRGGGYQGSRTTSNLAELTGDARDSRLDELAAMGLPAVWMRIADAIGVDAFLAMWLILDAEPSFQQLAAGEPIRITLRRYSSWLRFQRNTYIEAMAATGAGPLEIQRRLKVDLREDLSLGHISRIVRGAKIRDAA